MRSNRERDIMPSLCKGGCRTKRGGRVVKVRTTRVKQPFRQARSSPATVSAAQGERRLSHGFCPQWQKPQFAAHARHTVAMRIMRGSPPCTGEARKSTCLVPTREAREVRRVPRAASPPSCPYGEYLRRRSSPSRCARSLPPCRGHAKRALSLPCPCRRVGRKGCS